MNRIIGIVLVKNEDLFISWAIRNVAAFCDDIIVLDNRSTDRTPERLAALAGRFGHLRLHTIDDPNRSHRFVEGYAGTPTWVFAVDGDEIYDPVGLARLRPRIVAGELDAWWKLSGHMLNPTAVDLVRGEATGYGTPATPSVTKLFNFGALESWREPHRQRLHGDGMVFRPGYSGRSVLKLFNERSWDECDLRCLHLCFFPRSSAATEAPVDRKNPSQVKADPPRLLLERIKNFLRHPLLPNPRYKTRRYRRGPLQTRDISAFGRPGAPAFDEARPGGPAGGATPVKVLATRASTHG